MIRAQWLRLERGESIAKVAQSTGVSHPTISRLERTEKAGSHDVLAALAKHYGIENPSDLLTQIEAVEKAA